MQSPGAQLEGWVGQAEAPERGSDQQGVCEGVGECVPCVCVCVHAHEHACTHMCTHACTSTRTHVCAYSAHMCACARA